MTEKSEEAVRERDKVDLAPIRQAYAELRETVKRVSRKADSYSLQLEQTRMACTAAESQARVAKLDTNATARLLNEAIEQLRVLELRVRHLESLIPANEAEPVGS